jgi:hypothetical protein
MVGAWSLVVVVVLLFLCASSANSAEDSPKDVPKPQAEEKEENENEAGGQRSWKTVAYIAGAVAIGAGVVMAAPLALPLIGMERSLR